MFPNRAKTISLVITSLVAGVLLLLNLQRTPSAQTLTATPESAHGWPLVYLLRQTDGLKVADTEIVNPVVYAWPWPIAENELRTFSWMNLITNAIVFTAIIGVTYMMTNTILGVVFQKPTEPTMLS